MNAAHKLLILMSGQDVGQYIANVIQPDLWQSLDETTGATAFNRGIGGSALDAANTAATIAQAGKLGANHAYDFNGTTSLLTVTNAASIQGLTELTAWALVYADSAGEASNGTLFQKSGEWDIRYNSAALALTAQIAYTTTTAVTVTTTTLSTGAWHTVSMKINDSTKTLRIFIDGVEAGYSVQTPGVGTRVSNTNNLIIGNISTAARTWDGRIDEVVLKNAEISDAQNLTLSQLVGVA